MCKSKCESKCVGSMIMWTLLVVGGLNWGLVGIFDWNLITAIFGDMSVVSRIVYILIAVAAIGSFAGCCCKKCKSGSCDKGSCPDGKCKDGVCEMKEDEECADCVGGACEMHGGGKEE